jgi:hypothetical protein
VLAALIRNSCMVATADVKRVRIIMMLDEMEAHCIAPQVERFADTCEVGLPYRGQSHHYGFARYSPPASHPSVILTDVGPIRAIVAPQE